MKTGQSDIDRPTAVCLVRPDISGLETPRHAVQAKRHTVQMGYFWLYTVRPPADHPDPIGYGLGIAAGLAADAIVVYDLATVDNMPSRVCEVLDLETVCPPTTWAAAAPALADLDHTHPEGPLSTADAFAIMQQHIDCHALECPRKASAYTRLVRAGKVVPPVDTPCERAAARGIAFALCELHAQPGPDLRNRTPGARNDAIGHPRGVHPKQRGGFGVLIRQLSHRECLHRTKTEDGRRVTWKLVGTTVEVLYVCFPGSSETAYQWPDKPMPFAPPGLVSFGDERPDISEARSRLKKHDDLWDAVRCDYWDALNLSGPIVVRRVPT